MSPNAVECKMHIVHACRVPLDEESVCERAMKKFQDMKKVVNYTLFPQVCCLHGELCQSDYLLLGRTQDKLSKNKVQFITLFSGFAPVYV